MSEWICKNKRRNFQDVLETILILVGFFTTDNRTPKRLRLFIWRHHHRRHLLQEEGGVSARGKLAQVQVHRLDLLLQLLLNLRLLVKCPLLAGHLGGGATRTIQPLGRIVNSSQSAERKATKLRGV